ncbi:DUF1990 domain-containing protein [Roseisolibacter sp. H3M3-2]|uniref:DUF1990 family protein n=1 Tax=Roseisolibacter sp. H3M3-2 TaxID=3031323 RepID=UPI0023DCDE23|nr:DUF1990 domain-containing protein [Roseisolibacter sp. H3M3-2]MDF1505330.1 DUF1990 domain-containing protein [Roseisolibacter sp. H3M3-2]
MPFRLSRPGDRDVAAFLAAQRDAPFSYAEVGASRDGPAPPGYVVDHRRVRLGDGAAAFARAVAALRAWRMTALGWAHVHPAGAPQAPGAVVAVVVRHHGVWSLHACRVVYAVDESRRAGFAYGTLPAHAAAGEERFLVERDADDAVWYDLRAFSRPAHPLTRLGRPLARRLQRRFGHDSAEAMLAAIRP